MKIQAELIILILNRHSLQGKKRKRHQTPSDVHCIKPLTGWAQKTWSMRVSLWERSRAALWLGDFSILLLVILFHSISQQQLVAVRMSLAFHPKPTEQVRPLFNSSFQIQNNSYIWNAKQLLNFRELPSENASLWGATVALGKAVSKEEQHRARLTWGSAPHHSHRCC